MATDAKNDGQTHGWDAHGYFDIFWLFLGWP